MTVRASILRFLRDPAGFADGAPDPVVWRAGLTDFVAPAIAAANGYPLRPAQVAAWEGLAESRAGLVLGPPGTGKTHLLTLLILGYIEARRRAGLSCRVFVSAFTRNAIGNLLDALAGYAAQYHLSGAPVWFFGTAPDAGLSQRIQHHVRLDGKNLRNALQILGTEPAVIGGSIWSLYRLLESGLAAGADGLTAELFDLVCLDEASQMVLGHGLLALGGLKPEGRVVVAGDDRQLPPIRAAREVNLGGRALGGSLYSFLKSAGTPEFALDETFRLNSPLAGFPEQRFYPGAYRSAVPEATLSLRSGWQVGLAAWERVVLDPAYPIAILFHEGPPAATSSPFEARLAARLAECLAERFEPGQQIWAERLAIVSPHRAQNAAIRRLLPPSLRAGAFVETVDRIQGKERDAVILSYSVADAEFALAESDFIFAPERLNVAVTRARTKLIVLISRRLLSVVPTDQAATDKAELLREFVFSCVSQGEVDIADGSGGTVSVQLRLKGFADTPVLADLEHEAIAPTAEAIVTPAQAGLLEAIRAEALVNRFGNAADFALKRRLARQDSLLPDMVVLHHLGFISIRSQNGAKGEFWVARPFDRRRRVFSADLKMVRERIEQAVTETRTGRKAPIYLRVRDRFAWMDSDGQDVLIAVLHHLRDEGFVKLHSDDGTLRIDVIEIDDPSMTDPLPLTPELSDDDFVILNSLEDREAKRINFGVFEMWTSAPLLADETGRSRDMVAAALGRLAVDGWVMLADEGRVRSRMAELAREVRYVKQRFAANDAGRRPYLVRSLKVEVRDRDRPVRDQRVSTVLKEISATTSAEFRLVLGGLAGALADQWGEDAKFAAFQVRGLEMILSSWVSGAPDTIVVSADTGSGKTEAAILPLIAAAASDRIAGLLGTRAILTYPRVRLAANQAQRLAGYLAAFARQKSMPTLTLGVQFTQVPRTFEDCDQDAGWRRVATGVWSFPLFGCPACDDELLLYVDGGELGVDRLDCPACGWRFGGWIGSKAGLGRNPPAFFLPTTDSLHQWLHDPRYGALFGDRPGFAPPRALLADEIHLYSHVHGAQVGLALRRLAARCALNSGNGLSTIAIGMSATLGDPAAAWGRLVGREGVQTIGPQADLGERTPNPRSREYFYFVQPEVESRGQDIAGASTTIQSLMCLAHGMRRRRGKDGGYRGLIFLDSIDKVRRLHGAYQDAEEIRRLPAFRTRLYPDDPVTGAARDRCCGEPHGCDCFRDGECWWFAANDLRQVGSQGVRRPGRPLKVADQPVFSGTKGRVERLIRDSDIVFTTSSLEVGYDDPDIGLVYQQYAPQNVASFIQRKGRGGRGADDRPVTGTTLSIYSSRDSWWFRRPVEMIDPSGFETPLNPDNHFVRRGQVLAATLDGLARFQAKGTPAFTAPGRLHPAAMAEAEALVCAVFGGEPWREFDGCKTLQALWDKALRQANGEHSFDRLDRIRGALSWIPNFLFETINLPQLRVQTAQIPLERSPREDVALVLQAAAPGNATRRFDGRIVHWRPPVQGRGPWFEPADYATGLRARPFASITEILARLPITVRPALADLSPEVFRPRTVRLDDLGTMLGTGWSTHWKVSDEGRVVRTADTAADDRRVQHDSRGALRGFPIVKATSELARLIPAEPIANWVERLESFVGDGVGGKLTGLALARLFWGADAELKLAGRNEEPAVFTQIFTNLTGQPMLHGYHVQTEGVRYKLRSDHLDAFVAAELLRLDADAPARRWHAGQMLRFFVESGAEAAGANIFDARRGAELMLSAASDPDVRTNLANALRFWDAGNLAAVFESARAQRLSQHPLLSRARVARVADALSDQRFQPIFREAIAAALDSERFGRWIRTCVIHALAGRLKESFLQVGRGDERQVVAHVALPIQFDGPSEDIITICEAGAYGDGTARAFLRGLDEAHGHWTNGFIGGCPNADEDAALRRLLAREDRHEVWRALDPNDVGAITNIAVELGLEPGRALPASALRVLFGTETVGEGRFDLYDLGMAIARTDATLAARMGRTPSAWELTSATVEAARANPSSMPGRLLEAYNSLEGGALDGSLSAEARLADQVHRLGARLCVDGCLACVHHVSDIMSETLVEASTSRSLLQRFLAFKQK